MDYLATYDPSVSSTIVKIVDFVISFVKSQRIVTELDKIENTVRKFIYTEMPTDITDVEEDEDYDDIAYPVQDDAF